MLEIDHVIIGVANPEAAAARLRERFGLGALPGGLHPGGTGNWLIPLRPPQYVELLYIADAAAVAAGPSAALLNLDLTIQPLLGWALRTDDIAAIGRRLGIDAIPGSVHDPDGSQSRWRTVADPLPSHPTARPFFVEYEDPESLRPGHWQQRYAAARHDIAVGGVAWVEVGGDEDIREWIGTVSPPIRYPGGAPGLRAVAVASPAGDLILRPGAWSAPDAAPQ